MHTHPLSPLSQFLTMITSRLHHHPQAPYPVISFLIVNWPTWHPTLHRIRDQRAVTLSCSYLFHAFFPTPNRADDMFFFLRQRLLIMLLQSPKKPRSTTFSPMHIMYLDISHLGRWGLKHSFNCISSSN